jgi:hypothetical protein
VFLSGQIVSVNLSSQKREFNHASNLATPGRRK